jgi:hypothetical protein
VGVGREPAHVDADFAEDGLGAKFLDAEDGDDLRDGGTKGGKLRLHSGIDLGDGGERIDLIEVEAQQETMVLGHAAAQRLAKLILRPLSPLYN